MNDFLDQICLGLRNIGRAISKAFNFCLDCCIDGFYAVADALGYILSIPVAISDYICIRAERAEFKNEHSKDNLGTIATFTDGAKERWPRTCKYCSGEHCGLDEFKPKRE